MIINKKLKFNNSNNMKDLTKLINNRLHSEINTINENWIDLKKF